MKNDPLPFHLHDNGEGDGTSRPIVVAHYWGHAVQIDGEFVGNVIVKGRLAPGLGYAEIDTLTAPGLLPIQFPVHDLVIEVSDYASGQVVAQYAGYKIR